MLGLVQSDHPYGRAVGAPPRRPVAGHLRPENDRPSPSKTNSAATTAVEPVEQNARPNRSAQHRTNSVEINEVDRSEQRGTPRRLQTEMEQRTSGSGTPRIPSVPSPYRSSQSPHAAGQNIQVHA